MWVSLFIHVFVTNIAKINQCARTIINVCVVFFIFFERTRLKSYRNFIRNHPYVPVHGMQWVWLVMVAALVVSHVDGYRCVKGGEEMMGTCAEQTESGTKTTLTVFSPQRLSEPFSDGPASFCCSVTPTSA